MVSDCIASDRSTPAATRYDSLSYLEVLERGLKVMDTTALGANRPASLTKQVDVYGRWRSRAAVGDSLRHTVMGVDSTLTANLYAMTCPRHAKRVEQQCGLDAKQPAKNCSIEERVMTEYGRLI